MSVDYPRIAYDFDQEVPFGEAAVHRILGQICPPSFFRDEEAAACFDAQMPFISWTALTEPPFELSFFLCCHFRPNAFRFFYEMVSRWLIPGKRLNALLLFAADFSLPDLSMQRYICGEVRVRIENRHELDSLQHNLPTIESELRLGVESSYQASRILEIKGLSADEKTALIQENITSLIHRRPQDFDFDILTEMQHFLVMCQDAFKADRTFRHMSRIICVHYLFRRALKLSFESFPERRYISVKLVRAKLQEQRAVLGIAVGVSFIRENELFDLEHLLSGVQAIIPKVREVPGSFFQNRGRSDSICTFYLEVEGDLTLEEQRELKEALPDELESRIEKRLNPLFMPQNEEMVMRHIVSLSHQLKFVRDLPQLMIEFNQQLENELEFLVILTRVLRPGLPSIADRFKSLPSFLTYLPDRQKIVGKLRNKFQKEASVFYVRLRKEPFFRKNHDVDLYKARQAVSEELRRLIGTYRDYNGGFLAKESELFAELKASLGEKAEQHGFLLENFFFALNPPVMRSLLPIEPIEKLFLILLEDASMVHIQEGKSYLCALITTDDSHMHERLKLEAYEGKIATCLLPRHDHWICGVILHNPTPQEALTLKLSLEEFSQLKY